MRCDDSGPNRVVKLSSSNQLMSTGWRFQPKIAAALTAATEAARVGDGHRAKALATSDTLHRFQHQAVGFGGLGVNDVA
jgi:hypothetical protein